MRQIFKCEASGCDQELNSVPVTHMILCGMIYRFCSTDHLEGFRRQRLAIVSQTSLRRRTLERENNDGA